MACNISCDYCYVTEKHGHFMSIDLAQRVIRQVMAYNDPGVATNIYWHGAEPLLVGIEYFQTIFAWARQEYGLDTIHHHIQTNGLLLNETWFDLFILEHVTVGVSLDGPADIHDTHRKTRNGHGTFQTVFDNIMAARRKKLFFDALCVINRTTLGREDELFDFFAEHRIDFGFEPIVPETDWARRALSITPDEYAQVAIRLFDRWLFQPEGRVRMVVPPYHFATAILQGGHTNCTFSPACSQRYLAVSPNGVVHSCIMFARQPQYAFGNLAIDELDKVLNSPLRLRSLIPRVSQIEKCRTCEWAALCNAGCPHHAFAFHGTTMAPDWYCESYKQIFAHAQEVMQAHLVDTSSREAGPRIVQF